MRFFNKLSLIGVLYINTEMLVQALPVDEKKADETHFKVNDQASFDAMRTKLNNAEATSKDVYSDL